MNPKKKRQIEFSHLAYAISNITDYTRKKLNINTKCRFEEDPNAVTKINNSYVRDYNAYIKSLQKWVQKENLEDYIIFKQNKEKKNILEAGQTINSKFTGGIYTYFTKYTIVVRNLIILVGMEGIDFVSDPIHTDECYPPEDRRVSNQYNGGIHIVFENNQFQAKTYPHKNDYVNFYIGQYSFFEFRENSFNKVDIYLQPIYVGNNSFLLLENNKFDNRHTSIALTSKGMGYNSSGWTMSSKIAGKIEGKINLERMINSEIKNESDKIKIDLKDINYPVSNSIAIIKNNKFTYLGIYGLSKFFFRGKNQIINYLDIGGETQVHFDSIKSIDTKSKNIYPQKEIFVTLKNMAISNHSLLQEEILDFYIRKYEEKSLNCSYRFKLFFKDNRIKIWSFLIFLATLSTIISAVIAYLNFSK